MQRTREVEFPLRYAVARLCFQTTASCASKICRICLQADRYLKSFRLILLVGVSYVKIGFFTKREQGGIYPVAACAFCAVCALVRKAPECCSKAVIIGGSFAGMGNAAGKGERRGKDAKIALRGINFDLFSEIVDEFECFLFWAVLKEEEKFFSADAGDFVGFSAN